MQEFYIESITWHSDYNPNSNITLYVRHKGAMFQICYVAEKLADSSFLLKQHHNSYKILHKDNPGSDEIRECLSRLRKPFKELMTQLASNLPIESTVFLHGYLYPL